MLRKLTSFVLATGASSALAFVAVLLLARRLPAAAFVTVNLVLVLGSLSAQLGAGFDSASARQLSQSRLKPGEAVSLSAVWRTGTWLLSLVPIAAAVVVTVDGGRERLAAGAGAAAIGAAMGVMALSLIEPQASGSARAYGTRQFLYYVPMLLASGAGALVGRLLPTLLLMVAGASVAALLLLVRHLIAHLKRVRRPLLGSSEYRRLAGTIVLSGIGFSLVERLDLIAATAAFALDESTDFAAAARLTVVLAILLSAFQSLNISVIGRATSITELDEALTAQGRNFAAITGLTVMAALVAWVLAPVLFGDDFDPGFVQMLLLFAPYALYGLYSAYSLALAAIGHRRSLLAVSLVGAAVKCGVIALSVVAGSIDLLYASTLIAAAASLTTTVVVRRRLTATVTGG